MEQAKHKRFLHHFLNKWKMLLSVKLFAMIYFTCTQGSLDISMLHIDIKERRVVCLTTENIHRAKNTVVFGYSSYKVPVTDMHSDCRLLCQLLNWKTRKANTIFNVYGSHEGTLDYNTTTKQYFLKSVLLTVIALRPASRSI